MQRRISELDGLRGVAILLVLLVHFGSVLPASTTGERWIQAVCASGWSGVDLFFVLSGFLITGILIDTRNDPGYFRKFFARRVLRIFPLYYGVLLFVFVAIPVWLPGLIDDRLQQNQWSLWLYLSNLQSVIGGPESMRGAHVNFAHFWSLAIEEQFYLIWPFIVFWVGPRQLPKLCLMLIVLGIPTRLVAAEAYGPFAPYYFTPCRLETLAWGGLCACLVRRWSVASLRKLAWYSLAIGAAGLMLMFIVRGGLRFSDPVATIYGQSCFAACFSGLLLLACYGSDTVYGQCLRSSILQSLGKYSYGIYVFHGLLQVFLWSYAERFLAVSPNYTFAVATYVTACGAVCYVLSRCSWEYEKVFLNWKSAFDYDPPENSPASLAASA